MTRREFPRAVRVAVIKRATRDGVVYCEACGAMAKRWQIDHIIADAHGGEPVIENAMLICEPCYENKNPKDTTIAAKLKRIEAGHLGARKTVPRKIKSAPFPSTRKTREPKRAVPRRDIFTGAIV